MILVVVWEEFTRPFHLVNGFVLGLTINLHLVSKGGLSGVKIIFWP
jgi:hypothetical protein